jgi:N-acetylglucosaminyl-diphospho-decaprenol L-rhamnosyltransferase
VGLDLGVVIVSHNSADDLAGCLASVFEHAGGVELGVVVSDAGSSDDTPTVAAGFPVTFVPGPNEGFARRSNRVLRHPAIAGSRYLLFLNPDTEIREGAFAELIARCDELPGSAVFSVRQVNRNGRLVYSAARFPNAARTVAESFLWRAARRYGQKSIDDGRYGSEHDCDWADGAFLLVRRDVLEQLGGFDERFFLYSEEVDLCRRARELGHRVTYLPLMTVTHDIVGRPVDARAYYLARSQVIYARKWFSPVHRPFFRAALVFKFTCWTLSRRRTPQERGRARLAIRGALARAHPRDG